MEEKMKEELKKKLTKEQYDVLVNKSTERPGSGRLLHNKDKGDYVCAACGNRLFDSDVKFESGTGWPSFYKAKKDAVKFIEDNSHLMHRTEVVCAKCGGHLGHVFDDVPEEKGKRFCINSCSLDFKKK